MEHQWNETDKGKPKYSGKNLSHFVHHKSHMERSGIEPWPPRWEASHILLMTDGLHVLLHGLIHRSFIYSYTNPFVNFIYRSAANWLCYVVITYLTLNSFFSLYTIC
jgi:hypothetical protein